MSSSAVRGSILQEHGPFPVRLYELIGVAAEQGICRWDDNEFEVNDREQLCSQLLPLYFRHDRMDSFQRQLNMWVIARMRSERLASRRAGAARARGGSAHSELLLFPPSIHHIHLRGATSIETCCS